MCPGQWVFVLFAEGLVFLVINLFGAVAKIIIIIIISKIYFKVQAPNIKTSHCFTILLKGFKYINKDNT